MANEVLGLDWWFGVGDVEHSRSFLLRGQYSSVINVLGLDWWIGVGVLNIQGLSFSVANIAQSSKCWVWIGGLVDWCWGVEHSRCFFILGQYSSVIEYQMAWKIGGELHHCVYRVPSIACRHCHSAAQWCTTLTLLCRRFLGCAWICACARV